ncbi:M23 family metallopeptidase [Intrasporangium sp. YIM S08009]|uniref:murein hydrolase activator EnvC family protein n=1 Tax=Intrasporangium zincisolvens TaxID=3080018 RepID=UPI002B05A1A3|nr:M23 family metallopeptidase [Intrasporangium sp. YIM S08009]
MALGSGLTALVTSAVLGVGAAAGTSLEPPGPPALQGRSSASGVQASWAWPLDPEPHVERGFDPPDQPWGAGHRGVDLASAVGQQVRSPESGTVTWAGVLAGRGVVVVTHPGGLRSTFEPVTATVPVGAAVARGGPVGAVTALPGHCAPATCLHWGVLRGRQYLDPLAFVGRAPIVLLPLG